MYTIVDKILSVERCRKRKYGLIAAEMGKHGHKVSGPQCLSKFSGLKRTYKAIKDNNKKSGAGPKTWPYFSVSYYIYIIIVS